jgi:hypothetical protein
MNDAQIHAEIAKRVYPDAEIVYDRKRSGLVRIGRSSVGYEIVRKDINFNLLETDSNGNPTQQAKASALDVLCWLNTLVTGDYEGPWEHDKGSMIHMKYDYNSYGEASTKAFIGSNPCAVIYEAAKEVIDG